jgi:hypothetical protein
MTKDRILDFSYSKIFLFVVCAGFFLSFFLQEGLAQQPCNGIPAVGKWVWPTSVEAGDPVHVILSVQGCSGILSQPVNFDGVLVIDMSNSMDDDLPE